MRGKFQARREAEVIQWKQMVKILETLNPVDDGTVSKKK